MVYYGLNEDQKVDWPSAQYELYNLKQDGSEMNNLLPVNGEATSKSLELKSAFHKELTQLMELRKVKIPDGWFDKKFSVKTNTKALVN